MRIPPAIAQQIGQHYAAARVNDDAARQLGSAAGSLDTALVMLGSSEQSSALVEARTAADLVAAVATSAETALDGRVRAVAGEAATVARHAVDLLSAGHAPIDLLAGLRSTVAGGARFASDAAAFERFAAEELASQWM